MRLRSPVGLHNSGRWNMSKMLSKTSRLIGCSRVYIKDLELLKLNHQSAKQKISWCELIVQQHLEAWARWRWLRSLRGAKERNANGFKVWTTWRRCDIRNQFESTNRFMINFLNPWKTYTKTTLSSCNNIWHAKICHQVENRMFWESIRTANG